MANYLNVPTGSGASTPDQAGLVVGTTSIDLRCEITPNVWSGAAFQSLVNQYTTGGATATGTRWGLWLTNTGTVEFDWNSNGTLLNAASSVATGFTNGTSHGIRVLHNVLAGTADFYTSTDFSAWTSLGTQVTGLNTSTYGTAGTAPVVRIGTDADSENCIGRITRTQVIVNGSTILNENWTTANTGAGPWVATSGETWTALGTASVMTDTPNPNPGPQVPIFVGGRR